MISFIINSTGAGTLAITGTRLYAPFLTLSAQGSAKLLDQLKSGFERTIYWNKNQSKVLIKWRNQYFVIDPNLQWVARPFVQ